MKTNSLLICMILALLIFNPAFAANPNQPTGDRLSIYYSGYQEFPASTAFYIQHGWTIGGEDYKYPIGRFDFKLEVDGVYVKESYVKRDIDPNNGNPIFYLGWVFNFPDGMTGTHTFNGHWYEPCQAALDLGHVTECASKNTPVEVGTTEVIVTFTP